MTQVKIFAGNKAEHVEEQINKWLAERKLISIDDIKWSIGLSTYDNVYQRSTEYSALVIYQCQSEE